MHGERLNAKRIPYRGGDRWTARQVLACLRARAYAAPITDRCKLTRKPVRRGKKAPDQWVRRPKAREGHISQEQVLRAQTLLA